MKAIRKCLIVMLVLVYANNSQAQTNYVEITGIYNQEIQDRIFERFEKRAIKNKKEELVKNEIGKKIISRRRALNQK
jgi:hypothetical protein